MESALEAEIRETFDELINEFSLIPDRAINIVPFEGSWTAGQLAEHILKSISGLPELLTEESESPDRPPDQNVEKLRSIFLNYSTKMQAPVFVRPSVGPHIKNILIQGFLKMKSGLIKSALELDLTGLCKGFEFPTMGYFTRMEWLTFSVVHTRRHLEQLKQIHQSLALKF